MSATILILIANWCSIPFSGSFIFSTPSNVQDCRNRIMDCLKKSSANMNGDFLTPKMLSCFENEKLR